MSSLARASYLRSRAPATQATKIHFTSMAFSPKKNTDGIEMFRIASTEEGKGVQSVDMLSCHLFGCGRSGYERTPGMNYFLIILSERVIVPYFSRNIHNHSVGKY